MGGIEVKWRVVLPWVFAWIASWLGLAVLIILSVTAGNLAARLLLLTWVLAIVGWLAVYAGQLRPTVRWWGLAVMAPALPLIGAVLRVRRSWKR